MYILERDSINQLFDTLKQKGYEIIGPTVEDQAIVYDHIDTVEDLPVGWTDVQKTGSYRLKKRKDKALFGYVVGPTSWKKFLFPPATKLWEGKRTKDNIEIKTEQEECKR